MKSKKDIHILLVEDDEIYRGILANIVRAEGYQVSVAENGKVAQKILSESAPIHLVLSDVQMPGGDGIELLEYIRQKNPEIPPVVIMTGFSMTAAEEIKRKGAVAILEKPFAPKTLYSALEQALLSVDIT